MASRQRTQPSNPLVGQSCAARLARPDSPVLAQLIEARMLADGGTAAPADLPQGVTRDLRPAMPRVSGRALGLYLNRSVVNSFPLSGPPWPWPIPISPPAHIDSPGPMG